MSVWLVFYHGGSAFHCESFLLGASYLTVLVTAHRTLCFLSGIEEGPLAFGLFWKSSGDKIDLADVVQEGHETALELRPAAEEKAREKEQSEVPVNGEEHHEEEEEEKQDNEQLETPAKKETKKTRKKDPNAPKRPKTAYQLFCNDNRAKVRLEYGALSLGEVSAKLAEFWKQALAETKQEYEGKAAPGKERYSKEKKEYEARIKKGERHNEGTPRKARDDDDDFVDTTERLSRKRMLYATGGEGLLRSKRRLRTFYLNCPMFLPTLLVATRGTDRTLESGPHVSITLTTRHRVCSIKSARTSKITSS